MTDASLIRRGWSYSTDMECYSADRTVDYLVDIVSKNGCLLLNLAPHPDGTIPEEQKKRLRELGRWLRLNGEAIYGSRPWLMFGEGPTQTPVGHVADVKFEGFTSRDIRFTTRAGILYAIALGWPETGNTLTIGSLGTARYAVEITEVSLVGHAGKLTWRRRPEGLVIDLPSTRPCEHAFVFKITRAAGR
jgi:alpha-L-fucosidase